MPIPPKTKHYPYEAAAKQIEHLADLEVAQVTLDTMMIWFSYYADLQPDRSFWETGGEPSKRDLPVKARDFMFHFTRDLFKARLGEPDCKEITPERREQARQYARELKKIEIDLGPMY